MVFRQRKLRLFCPKDLPWETTAEFLAKRMSVFASLLSRELMEGWGFPPKPPSSRCFPTCHSARPQWVVTQEEAPSRALVTGRTVSVKSPCKSPFLCSARTPLTPTDSWRNINSPVKKKKKSGAPGPERDRRAVWGSRRVSHKAYTAVQCPLFSCFLP